MATIDGNALSTAATKSVAEPVIGVSVGVGAGAGVGVSIGAGVGVTRGVGVGVGDVTAAHADIVTIRLATNRVNKIFVKCFCVGFIVPPLIDFSRLCPNAQSVRLRRLSEDGVIVFRHFVLYFNCRESDDKHYKMFHHHAGG